MASDKARFEFSEHMQSRGFSWLDQYLEDVVEKAREGDDELFDLMKTPGRKKVVRKGPATGSRLKNIVPIFEQDEDMESKENVAPVQNTFYQALLAAKSPEPTKALPSPRAPDSSPLPEQTVRRISSHPRDVSPPLPTPTLDYQDNLGFPQFPHMDPVALSMIVEDDEGSGRGSSHTSYAAERAPLQAAVSNRLEGQAIKEQPEDMEVTSPRGPSFASTTDTFHSIPMSPDHTRHSTERPQEDSKPATAHTPEHTSSLYPTLPAEEPAPEESKRKSGASSQDATASKTEDAVDTVMSEVNPSADKGQYTDDVVPLRDDDATSGNKPPSPLRKSLRAVREQSSGAILVGAATPGPSVGASRTSWLMKTRAVNRKVSGMGGPAHVPRTTMGGTKRKSEDTMHIPGLYSEDDTRHAKTMKFDNDVTSGKPVERAESARPMERAESLKPIERAESTKPMERAETAPPTSKPSSAATDEGILDRLRKTMQGMKPVGPLVSNEALADAKASAEAKVAERHQADASVVSMSFADGPSSLPDAILSAPTKEAPAPINPEASRRMSVSELMPSNDKADKASVFKFAPPPAPTNTQHTARVSTTPANSPPPASHPAPVFSKPRVFVPPPDKKPSTQDFHFQPAAVRNVPTAISNVGLSPRLQSPPSHKANALSAQSTVESIASETDRIFDTDVEIPGSWEPTTQDTEYSFPAATNVDGADIVDDDDWSDDGGPVPPVFPGTDPSNANTTDIYQTTSTMTTASYKMGVSVGPTMAMEDKEVDLAEADQYFMDVDNEKDAQPTHAKATTPTEDERPASQLSDASSVHPTTLFGHAHKFVSSMLGSGKKAKATTKPEVKSLQLAAAAAKKQQDEQEKKEKRLKEMENRRLLAAQRKADEEKARKEEQERKAAEDRERRKREREETTGKLPVPVARSKEEDATKKRKIELQKQPSKTALKPPSSTTKTLVKSNSKLGLASSSTTPAHKAGEMSKAPPSLKGKGKAPAKIDDDGREPSQVVQSSMAARAKAQMQAAQAAAAQSEPNPGPTDNIELPDINSEYSDSDDEDRGRDVADWAQSPDLARMLRVQSTINPDDIFGEIRPLRMEEMFKTRQSRFRARTSSANWTGTDRLTVEEEREYARRMGYR
ncbi:hypothetical protein K525DRAFT_253890 [Schizophyllum commune Loenen D]|nr:hypothetical protein K525DRAFT_253890 [Schizophyllum commune Loenen D]